VPNLTITMKTRNLFTDEVRAILSNDLALGNPAGVIGVSDDYFADSDTLDVADAPNACAWLDGRDGITQRNLYGAPIAAVHQAATAQFVAFGHDPLEQEITETIKEMIVHKTMNTTYTAICLSFGVIILDGNPSISMALEAEEEGLPEITHEVLAANIAILLDKGLSNHARIEVAPFVESFLDRMVKQTLDARGDRARFAPWLEDLTFTAVPA
tara:strand:+ start:203 stop:841 length:639 start_codon:yes stop_codon:yes gene_type:complete